MNMQTKSIAIVLTVFVLAGAVLLLAVSGMPGSEPTRNPNEIRVMTFNVKVDIEEAPSVWQERKDLCATVVKDAMPDIVGFQETSPNQLAFFQGVLSGYGTVGNLKLTPEELDYLGARFPPVKQFGIKTYTDAILMYREDAYEKLDEGYWWQSPTPEKLSVGFGNFFPRIAVWARLKHKATGRELVVVDTHFDNTSPAQEHMAKLSHEQIEPFLNEGLPVLFVGDFNTSPARETYAVLTSGAWNDSYMASPQASENGRDNNVTTTRSSRIDHIFYHGDALRATHWTRFESPDPDKRLSDHFPVLAVLEWQ